MDGTGSSHALTHSRCVAKDLCGDDDWGEPAQDVVGSGYIEDKCSLYQFLVSMEFRYRKPKVICLS